MRDPQKTPCDIRACTAAVLLAAFGGAAVVSSSELFAAESAKTIPLTVASSHTTGLPWVGVMASLVVPESNARLEASGSPYRIRWTETYHLMTNFPVRSVEDLRGRKILAPGPTAAWLEGTGAVAVDGGLTLDERLKWLDGMPNIAGQSVEATEKRAYPAREVLRIYTEAVRSRGGTPLRDWDRLAYP